tara:strand:+ start:3609 stop:4127 length:519 start_codon:yes stop_codon:yes gene_type:complete
MARAKFIKPAIQDQPTRLGPTSVVGNLSITGIENVSQSIAAAGGGGTTPTLQQVTDQGSSTTTPITASIISASGHIIGDIIDTSFETFVNFEAATSFTFITPFELTISFTGSSTSSMEVVGLFTASANTETFSSQQTPPIELSAFDKLKISPSSSGLFIFSGSKGVSALPSP